MLTQKYEKDLSKIHAKAEQKHEELKDLEKSNRSMGNKRLGLKLTHKMWMRDMASSNKYRKIEK